MQQISSRTTAFTKWGLPAVWIAVLVVLLLTGIHDEGAVGDPMFFFGPVVMLLIGLAFFRYYVWDLADVVTDYGSYLVARRRGVEARIAIENIMNVSSSALSNPKRVVLRLVQATALGNEVPFIPKTKFTLNPFAKIEVAEDLMQRAFAARARRS